MTFVVSLGTTETAPIDGISAVGANPDVMSHTPSADVEVLEYGRRVYAPFVPVSPSGCPTPSLIRRAVADLVDSDRRVIDAGVPMGEVRKRVIEYYDGLVEADGPG